IASFVWAINPHGINMAVVWLSGRTALCLTLFSLLAAIACVRQRHGLAAFAIALALLSKEEAVALPFVLLAWTWTLERERPRLAVVAVTLAPLVLYLAVRALTPAFTPATAPVFYRFTTDPSTLVRNLAEYFDRSSTIAIAVTAVAAALYR